MKSLRMDEERNLFYKEMMDPGEPGPAEVRVKMRYASICGFDMMTLAGKAAFPRGGVLGHEGSGVVEAIGNQVDPSILSPGDPVTINPYAYCGVCVACRSNHPEFCINPTSRADLMTEFINIDHRQVFRLPEGMGLKAGSLVEPLMMAMHAVRKTHMSPGETLLINGCGSMGQLILKVARSMPFGRIVVADPHEQKREAALRFGADAVLDPRAGNIIEEGMHETEGLGFTNIIEASGSQEAAQQILHLVSRGGTIVYFGLYGMDYDLKVNLMNLYWTDGYITAVCVPSGQFPASIALAEHLAIEEVITGVFPFEEGIRAFKEKAGGEHAKVMLEF